MFSVLVTPIEKNLLLSAKGNEIVIMSEYVSVLKGLKKSSEFVDFFLNNALINRPARKLFEAWLRKDRSLYKKIYNTIGEMDVEVKDKNSIAKKLTPHVKEKDETPKKKPAKPEATKKTTEKKVAAKKTTKKKTTEKKATKKKTTATKKTTKKKTTAKKATKKKAASKKKTTKKKTKK